jgi:hypothetical protein
MGRKPRTLVALIGETRATEITADPFRRNLLDALGADLALCVKAGEPANALYERARFVWTFEESGDWVADYDELAGRRDWRTLLGISDFFLDAIEYAGEPPPEGAGPSSDPILFFYRQLLRRYLERDGTLADYDWLIVTRSDFLWPLPHPDPRHLSARRLYTLDGEQYGGVGDRHFVVPRRFFGPYLSVTDPIFSDPPRLRRRIDEVMAEQEWHLLSSERFLAMRLRDLGLWRRVRYLPYVPYLVRPPSGETSWSVGVFHEGLGYYVKYPTELERSEIARRLLPEARPWGRYLSPVRGLPLRLRVRRAYRERGLYERDLRRRDPLLRFLRRLPERRARLRERRRRAAARLDVLAGGLGRYLRMIPGLSAVLDARLRRLDRRARRRQDPVPGQPRNDSRRAARRRRPPASGG